VQAPEAPQLALSVVGSMQCPPQSTRPAAQVTEQEPFEQTCPALHAVPQAPQLRLSLFSSTQLPPQTWAVPKQSGFDSEHPAARRTAAKSGT
jgi:hypothetical protein